MTIRKLENEIEKSGLSFFNASSLSRFLDISKSSAQKLLERYTKRGVFVRLKRDLYILENDKPSIFLIANNLYSPSYLSFETALSFHGLIPESIFTITSATSQSTRTFEALGQEFTYHKIKKEAFTGYETKDWKSQKIEIAEPEKALADLLYFKALGKKGLPPRLDIEKISENKLLSYIDLFDHKEAKKEAKKLL